MKILLTLGFIISPMFLWGQTDSIQVKKKTKGMIAVDLFSPIYSAFSENKGFEVMATYPITDKVHIGAEVGYESNVYDDNNWLAHTKGTYFRLGAQYFITQDDKNPQMGYYTGLRLAYSPYQQTIDSFLIKGNDDMITTSSFPQHNASAYWVEPLVGGRVQIMETPFYIDASLRIRVRAYYSNDYDMTPLQIPGFGNDNSGLGIGVNWSIAYKLPF